MIFHQEELLYLLFFIPLIVIGYYFSERKRTRLLVEFGNMVLLNRSIGSGTGRRKLKFFLFIIAVIFMILAVAQPQFGMMSMVMKGRGVDIMVALDTSKSMFAEDVKPDRFEKARFEILNLIERLRGNSIGLIAFSGKAFPECPMTLDYGVLRMVLDSLSVGMIPVPGTALEEAIRMGVLSLKRGRAKTKVLVLITDGEDQAGDPNEALDLAIKEGVRIFTVGIGSREGVPIPLKDTNGKIRGYKTDREGKRVLTRLHSEVLEHISLKSGGGYFTGPDGIKNVTDQIEEMEKSDIGSRHMTLYEERFQYFVALALLFLIAEMLIPERVARQV